MGESAPSLRLKRRPDASGSSSRLPLVNWAPQDSIPEVAEQNPREKALLCQDIVEDKSLHTILPHHLFELVAGLPRHARVELRDCLGLRLPDVEGSANCTFVVPILSLQQGKDAQSKASSKSPSTDAFFSDLCRTRICRNRLKAWGARRTVLCIVTPWKNDFNTSVKAPRFANMRDFVVSSPGTVQWIAPKLA